MVCLRGNGRGDRARVLDGQADVFVYWTNENGTTLGRANLDGTGASESFITGASSPVAVAVDGQHVYWINLGADAISRANLDGTGADQSFITGAADPFGVAVDAQHIYWTNAHANSIGRANLDGSGVSQSFIVGASGADWGGGRRPAHLLGQLRRQLDRAREPRRQRRNQFFIGAADPTGVAVDGQHIYWANASTDTIGRANLDGSGVDAGLHHRRERPGRGGGRRPAHLLGRHRRATQSGARTSTARASIRASSPARQTRKGSRSTRCCRRRRRSAPR